MEMTQFWQGFGPAMPIVEFHDVRAEAGRSEDYLRLVSGPLATSYVRNGGAMLGQFRVDLHSDRLYWRAGADEAETAFETVEHGFSLKFQKGSRSNFAKIRALSRGAPGLPLATTKSSR